MSRKCIMHGGEKYMQNFNLKTRKVGDHFGDIGLDGR